MTLALAGLVGAVLVHRDATRPIGEADVFIRDADSIRNLIRDHVDPAEAVRAARNQLELEAVSVVSRDGKILFSTSVNFVNTSLKQPLLLDAINSGRFAGIAAPASGEIMIDGVREWEAGEVLYEVVARLDDSSAILLQYDVASLLGRRARPGAIQPATLELFGLGLVFLLLGAVAFYGRTRAARRYEALQLESELLRRHSAELQRKNLELAEARRRAERALSLAEEKVRIRSEFVLMINHELRTPLTGVVTGAELLRSDSIDASEKQTILEMIGSDGSRLLEIIDRILAVARIENSGLSHEVAIIPIEKLCESLSAEFIDPKEAATVAAKTDLKAILMVVESLTNNAKAHGASEVKVLCSTRPMRAPDLRIGAQPSSAVFVSVMDDGPGIDRRFLPRIFEKFEKSSFSSGTGLGLYMTRLVTEALECSIAVQTSDDGTTMEVAIPAVPAPNLVEVST